MITLVGLLSIAGSSYYMIYGEKLFHALKKIKRYLPGSTHKDSRKNIGEDHEVVLFGF
jgi:hypothetical protein